MSDLKQLFSAMWRDDRGLNTAELMGISDRKGQLKEGADADLVVLDADFKVNQVYARGLPVQ